MSNQRREAPALRREPLLLIPQLAPFYAATQPLAYALLRAAFGSTIVTHGIPKLLGIPHGSMADPMGGSISLINKVLNPPFAPQLAKAVALLEAFGGLGGCAGPGYPSYRADAGGADGIHQPRIGTNLCVDRPRHRVPLDAGLRRAADLHPRWRRVFTRPTHRPRTLTTCPRGQGVHIHSTKQEERRPCHSPISKSLRLP